jgi:hypothetical protein
MALDDLSARTYALPIQLVGSVIAKASPTPAICFDDQCLTEAATEGLKAFEDRLLKESSTTIFDGLNSKMYFHTWSGYGTFDVLLQRRHQIILALTAKEYAKSQDELLSLYLMQYLCG